MKKQVKLNFRNLVITIIFTGAYGISQGILWKTLVNYMPEITSIIFIIGTAILFMIGLTMLFPIYEKEKKEKKKNNYFKKAIMAKRK